VIDRKKFKADKNSSTPVGAGELSVWFSCLLVKFQSPVMFAIVLVTMGNINLFQVNTKRRSEKNLQLVAK